MAVTHDFTNGTVADADEVNANFTDVETELGKVMRDAKIVAKNNVSALNSIAVVSATIWMASFNDATNLLRSTNSGVTWANVAHNLGEASLGIIACDADATKLLCYGATQVSFSTDSGATWTASTTDPPNCTTIHDMSYPTTTMAVAVGNASAGNAQWRCIDPTVTPVWAQAGTGTTTSCFCVHMKDGNDGLMVDDDSKIWSTTSDAADTWTDTTKITPGSNTNDHIYCISVTNGIHIDGGTDVVSINNYNNANATYQYYCNLAGYCSSNIIKLTNGYYYCIFFPNSGVADPASAYLLKSTDAGVSWSIKDIGPIDNSLAATKFYGNQLQKYDTNKLLFAAHTLMCTNDESF